MSSVSTIWLTNPTSSRYWVGVDELDVNAQFGEGERPSSQWHLAAAAEGGSKGDLPRQRLVNPTQSLFASQGVLGGFVEHTLRSCNPDGYTTTCPVGASVVTSSGSQSSPAAVLNFLASGSVGSHVILHDGVFRFQVR